MTPALEHLLSGAELRPQEAEDLFALLTDAATPAVVVGAVLAALRVKGETSGELNALARAMRARALPCDLGARAGLVDIVGTGGDGSQSFNLSTGAALLAAAAGARVAKHGGGAVSSRSGSADLLTALGLPLPLPIGSARALLAETGFTFLHAPYFHQSLRGLSEHRRALGTRTVFNLLGPLCNPARPPFAIVGACSLSAARTMAEVLSDSAIERAFVVHGAAGWDEPTPIGPFRLFDVTPRRVAASVRDPRRVGLPRCSPASLRGGDAAANARALRSVFAGAPGAHRDALVLGAALALEVSSRCEDWSEGIKLASAALDDGRAARLLLALAGFAARTEGASHA